MGTPTSTRTTGTQVGNGPATDLGRRGGSERRSTETKSAFKTTEFMAYLGLLAALLLAGLIVDDAGDGGFGAQEVWRYATFLTIGYMISRGLAKSGSRDPYTHEHDDRRS